MPIHCIFAPFQRLRWRRRRRNAAKTTAGAIINCPVCTTKSTSGPVLPCGERYCAQCLRKQFTWTLRTVPYTPPRCCGYEIPLSLLKVIDGGSDLLKKFQEVVPDPLNCAKCAQWLLPEDVGEDKAVCKQSACKAETCIVCEKEAHAVGETCERTSAERCNVTFRRLANKKGWRNCAKCGFVLSRDVGCAEVVCRCGNIEMLAF